MQFFCFFRYCLLAQLADLPAMFCDKPYVAGWYLYSLVTVNQIDLLKH